MTFENSKRRIRVLVVDDSSLARELICTILRAEPEIAVVGEAANGKEAVAKVLTLKPDLVTMDIEMPVLGGLAAIEQIMREFPLPILVITAQSGVRAAFAAVAKGALDVIEKPDISLESAQNLIKKIRVLSNHDIIAHLDATKQWVGKSRAPQPLLGTNGRNARIVAIAASLGGPQALYSILSQLPADFPAPVLIAQHIADGFTQGMVEWLKSSTPLRVNVLHNGSRLLPGTVHVNPAELSVVAIREESVVLSERNQLERYRPSCNALLSSIAETYRDRAVGVILSGMGSDGVEGMGAIKVAGGITIAQDGQSSVVYGMNRLAIEGGHIDKVMPVSHIPDVLLQLVGK